jgi:hypothetical protein
MERLEQYRRYCYGKDFQRLRELDWHESRYLSRLLGQHIVRGLVAQSRM